MEGGGYDTAFCIRVLVEGGYDTAFCIRVLVEGEL